MIMVKTYVQKKKIRLYISSEQLKVKFKAHIYLKVASKIFPIKFNENMQMMCFVTPLRLALCDP